MSRRFRIRGNRARVFENKLNRQLQRIRRQVAKKQMTKAKALTKGQAHIKTTHKKVITYFKKVLKDFGITRTDLDLTIELDESLEEWATLVAEM